MRGAVKRGCTPGMMEKSNDSCQVFESRSVVGLGLMKAMPDDVSGLRIKRSEATVELDDVDLQVA